MRSYLSVHRFAVSALAGLSALLLTSASALAAGFSVPMDEVRMLNFPQPVTTVYVGNPVIADVTVIDSKRVFVLGKNFGTTNIVALDDKGNEVYNQHITVFGRTGSVVTLERGAVRTTYACAATRCELTPTVGDDKDPFENVTGQMDKRQALAQKAAQSDSGQ